MPNLNDVCHQLVDGNPQILASAVVEQDSALLLGLAGESEHLSLEYFETVAAAAVNIYRGKNISTVEKMIADLRGVAPVSTVEEVQLVMDKNSIFITAIPDKPAILAFVMTENGIDINQVWQLLHKKLAAITAAAP